MSEAKRCTLCGGPEHKTKKETLACSQTRREEFKGLRADLDKYLKRQQKLSGRLVWIEEHELGAWPHALAERWYDAAEDPVGACVEAVGARIGDAEHTVETVAVMLRALGRPYPLADWRER